MAFTKNFNVLRRRQFIRQSAFAAGLFSVRGLFAEELSGKPKLSKTAMVEEGPFYPYRKLPLDTDNDLIIVNDSTTPAVGAITHLSGRLMDANGSPVRNATIEIWQVDNSGVYLAARDRESKFDANFQGFGRFLTASTGEYYFRTIKPIAYPGRRAPHIHFKVKMKGHEDWTTQLFVKNCPTNGEDGIYRHLGDEKTRATVTVDFASIQTSRIGELAAQFDIVLGVTA